MPTQIITDLTAEQRAAVEKIIDWSRGSSQQITLGGYAGTGKTTLISHLLRTAFPDTVVLAPTGKACSVLKKEGVPARTIHSYLYDPHTDPDTGEVFFTPKGVDGHRHIAIVDESSMIQEDVYHDLLDTGHRFIFVGDHGQLQPVGRDPKLMADPDIKLETILRQALESPILGFAHAMRMGEHPVETKDDNGLTVARARDIDDCLPSILSASDGDVVLVFRNSTRVRVNEALRLDAREFFETPARQTIAKNDIVICLRNEPKFRIFNGETFVVAGHPEFYSRTVILTLADPLTLEPRGRVPALIEQFGQEKTKTGYGSRGDFALFDYGWAITVHKAQGSEWDNVFVLEERPPMGSDFDQKRWRYTACTRAAKSLRYFSPFTRPAER